MIDYRPPHNVTSTSIAAADFIAPHAPTQRQRVLDFIRSRGKGGATIAEIAEALSMRTASVCARVMELRGKSYAYPDAFVLPLLVVDSGMRRGGPGRMAGKVFVAVEP